MYLTKDAMITLIKDALIRNGVNEDIALKIAQTHTKSSYDGIYSHGTNRIPRFIDYIKKGWVIPNNKSTIEKQFGAITVLNGNLGPGVLNAFDAVDIAINSAKEYGIGLVGLNNTTHWMRGGSYGLYAASQGYVLISWTNTEANMPPWGGIEPRLGNNPFVMATPSSDGKVTILDMAMSQYAYGKLETTRLANQQLPYPGGFDKDGNLTSDPGLIEESLRILPTGYWKGSSFSFMLDILGAILTNGNQVTELDELRKGSCTACSQVFIVIDPKKITDTNRIDEIISKTKAYIKSSKLDNNTKEVLYPGEDFSIYNKLHDEKGIFIDDAIYEQIKAL